jgi:membrane-associated phospholipid phosphatase
MTSIVRNIAISSSLLAICLAIYMIPALLSIVLLVDEKAFYWFNGSLDIGYSWQLLWFYMNHNYEKNLNLVVFVLINVLIIINQPKETRKKFVVHFLWLIMFMQIAFLLKDLLFVKILQVKRLSPSLTLQPFISLSELFSSNEVKVVSGSSFPSGHAFSAAFWAIFTCSFVQRKYWPLIWLVAVPIIMNRLFSGAHWLSDIVVGVLLAWVMVYVSLLLKIRLFS